MLTETLASGVQGTINIKGLKMNNTKHKISLYADDIVLYIKYPEKSLPSLHNAIQLADFLDIKYILNLMFASYI